MVLLKESPKDWVLVGIVGLLAIGANIPEEWTDYLSIDRRVLLIGLIGFIAVALIRYLKFTFLLVVVLLAIGANLPDEIASEFGVDSNVAIAGLILMVIISLGNKVLKLPLGLDKSGRSKAVHAEAALFTAILKGRVAVVQSLVTQGVNINVRTVSGKTPLMAACFKGYGDIVQLLLSNSADVNAKDNRGDTALKISMRGKNTRINELLIQAGARLEEKQPSGPPPSAPPPPSDVGPSPQRTNIAG